MKLLLDENLSPTHARDLRAAGYDAVGVVEAGLGGASDAQVFKFAVDENRIILTLDTDFGDPLHFGAESSAGIVRLRLRRPTEAAIRDALRRTILLLNNVDLRGRLAVVDSARIRIRPSVDESL